MEITPVNIEKPEEKLHFFNVVNVNIANAIILYLNKLNETKIEI